MNKETETDIIHLLRLIDAVDVKRKEIEKIHVNYGTRYNIFDVLQLSSSEVRLHSSILASILGSEMHGAGSAFLNEFLHIPKLKLDNDFFDLSKVTVETEKFIGQKTDTAGGRIDLYLSDGIDTLIIENKIYADDQENQLLRYHNFEPKAKLVYLSLYGDPPSEKSIGALNRDSVVCLSYRDEIIPWLERCVQIASNLPYVRETINQYINTLKHLTNSFMAINEEIVDIIGRPENLSAAFAIQENLGATVNIAMNSFLREIKNGLSREGSPFKCITKESNDWLNQSWAGFQFVRDDWKNAVFATEYEGRYLSKMAIGLLKKAQCEDIRKIEGARVLAERLNYTKQNKSWYWGYPKESFLKNWYNADTINGLMDGRVLEWFVATLKTVEKLSEDLRL